MSSEGCAAALIRATNRQLLQRVKTVDFLPNLKAKAGKDQAHKCTRSKLLRAVKDETQPPGSSSRQR